MKLVSFVLMAIVFSGSAAFANCDSIGVKNIGGQLYILHKVTKGEGLYSIGRRYSTTPAAIQKADVSVKDGLYPGQIILVPYKASPKNASIQNKKAETKKENKPEKEKPHTEEVPVYHPVVAGETLFRIAKAHKIQVADIQKWNNFKGNEIEVGQKLVIGFETKEVNSKEKVLADGSLKAKKEENPAKENSDTKPLKTDFIAPKYEQQYTEAQKNLEENKVSGKTVWKEIQQSGVASWIDDGSIVSEKKLALHKTAPLGTVIELKNPMNNQKAYVKVIGRLQDDETEENVVLKITKSTAEKLGLRDKYFRLDMSYGMEVKK